MMSVDPGVLDANVLAYAVNADAPQHKASRTLLDAASDPAVTLYVTSQILSEFYSLITSPRRVAVVSSSAAALSMISAMLALPRLYLLPTPVRSLAGWMQLLQRHPVTGGEVFDLQIVATMQANGIQRITPLTAMTLGIPGARGSNPISPPPVFLCGTAPERNLSRVNRVRPRHAPDTRPSLQDTSARLAACRPL